jgi:hypothetical protein
MTKLMTVAATIDALRRARGDVLYGHACLNLEIRDRAARMAVGAIEDALRDVAWVDHDGRGDPPKTYPEYVQVRFRDGDTMCGIRWDWDQNWCWSRSGELHDGDIVAYRCLPNASESKLPLKTPRPPPQSLLQQQPKAPIPQRG